jgi:hypothetical protein
MKQIINKALAECRNISLIYLKAIAGKKFESPVYSLTDIFIGGRMDQNL